MKIHWTMYKAEGKIDVSPDDCGMTQDDWNSASQEEKEDILRAKLDEWVDHNAWDLFCFEGWEE